MRDIIATIRDWMQAQDWALIGRWTLLVAVVWPVQYLLVIPTLIAAVLTVGLFVLPLVWLVGRAARRNKGTVAAIAGGWWWNRQEQHRHDDHMTTLRATSGVQPLPQTSELEPGWGQRLLLPWATGWVRRT
jgi:hypothetical protein